MRDRGVIGVLCILSLLICRTETLSADETISIVALPTDASSTKAELAYLVTYSEGNAGDQRHTSVDGPSGRNRGLTTGGWILVAIGGVAITSATVCGVEYARSSDIIMGWLGSALGITGGIFTIVGTILLLERS